MDKTACELGVELALKDAGLVKEALWPFGPSKDETATRGLKMMGGGVGGLVAGGSLARGLAELAPNSDIIARFARKNPTAAFLGALVGGAGLTLGGARIGEHLMSGPEGREYWKDKLKDFQD